VYLWGSQELVHYIKKNKRDKKKGVGIKKGGIRGREVTCLGLGISCGTLFGLRKQSGNGVRGK